MNNIDRENNGAGMAGSSSPIPLPSVGAGGLEHPKAVAARPHLAVKNGNIVPELGQDGLEVWTRRLCSCLGLADVTLAAHLLSQLMTAGPHQKGLNPDEVDALLGAVAALAPRDGTEALLAVQAVVLHQNAMGLLARATATPLTGLAEVRLGLAEKLLKLFALQIRTLDGHRRQGQQTVRVEHVHVHGGGQAIVGNVQRGGGGSL